VDAWQRRHALAGLPVAVFRKFGEDRASSHAALMAYYAFFSLFPLLLVFVSVLGFVLEDNPSLADDIVDSTLARIPVIGPQLRGDVDPLTGSVPAIAIGVAGALWAGLGVTTALGRAFEGIWDVPRLEQRGRLRARAHGLAVLGVLGTGLVGATLLSGLSVGGALGSVAERVGALAIGLGVNTVLFAAAYRLLTPRPRRVSAVLPGAVVAAVGALILQAVGGWYVDRTVAGASETYGTFALVIGLLSWFWLVAHVVLLGAELNVVLRRRLWPRSLAGDLTPADRRAMRSGAEAARADRRAEIVVRFPNASADDDG
jgi:membrane protein